MPTPRQVLRAGQDLRIGPVQAPLPAALQNHVLVLHAEVRGPAEVCEVRIWERILNLLFECCLNAAAPNLKGPETEIPGHGQILGHGLFL